MHVPRLLPPLLFLALALATPAATSSREMRARSTTFVTGSMVVVWGDPFGPMYTHEGVGSQSLVVRGNVTARDDLPGYYTYDATRIWGTLHAEWTGEGSRYTLDLDFALETDDTPHMPTIVVPDSDAFIVTGMDFTGTLTVNGQTTSAKGMAATVATPPGLFGYDVQSRVNTVVLYRSELGAQFVICWSEKSQTIYGMEASAADHMRQKVLIA